MVSGRTVFALLAVMWIGGAGASNLFAEVPDGPTATPVAGESTYIEFPQHVRLAPANTPRPVAAAPEEMQFMCPDPVDTQLGNQGSNPQNANRVLVVYGCPYRVYDDGNPFGNPSLAVKADEVSRMAFASLHGDPDANGPSDVARSGETHTVFMTSNQGSQWLDEYTDPGFPNSAARGESSDIVMDEEGNVYVLYKWSRPQTGGWHGFLGLYKGGQTDESRSVKDSYLYGKYILPDKETNVGGSITDGGIVFVPDTGLPPPIRNASDDGDIYGEEGDEAVEYVPGDQRIVAMWHEETAINTTNERGWTGWIDAAWTDTSTNSTWERLAQDQRIGPCSDASRPVHYRGDLYISCTVAKGYDARARARIGQHDIWRLDMKTGTTEHVAYSRLSGGEPILTSTPDGYMVLGTHRVQSVGELEVLTPEIYFAVGWYGQGWSPISGDVGPALHGFAGTGAILDAGLTALEVTEDRSVFTMYKERLAEEQPEAPNFDPDDPLSATPHLTDYRKFMLTFNECGNFPITMSEFDLGGGMDAYNFEAYQQNPAIYNDDQDGLQVIVDPGTENEILYFAVNDYGAIQFGAVEVQTTGSPCFVTPPLFPTAPAAIPQALTLANPASIVTGSLLALPLAGMVGYLLTVKRRTASFVTAEDE